MALRCDQENAAVAGLPTEPAGCLVRVFDGVLCSRSEGDDTAVQGVLKCWRKSELAREGFGVQARAVVDSTDEETLDPAGLEQGDGLLDAVELPREDNGCLGQALRVSRIPQPKAIGEQKAHDARHNHHAKGT